jgi:hypothetical protein
MTPMVLADINGVPYDWLRFRSAFALSLMVKDRIIPRLIE